MESLSTITEPGLYVVTKTEGSPVELRRLDQIGLVPGMRVEILSCPQDGMMVLKVGGARLAIARGSGQSVWVRPKNAPR